MPDPSAPKIEPAARNQVSPDITRDNGTLRRFLHGLPGVDQAGAEARAAALATRSVKSTAKRGQSTPRSGWST
jgi:deoxyribose-phosphate aldolase